MKNTHRKKRRPPKKLEEKKKGRGGGGGGVVESEEEEEEKKKRTVLEDLVEAFTLSSDPGKASEILRKGLVEDPSVCSSSSSSSGGGGGGVSGSDLGSTSGSSEGFVEGSCGREDVIPFKGNSNRQKKKVVAATGTVSTVLGKGYVTRNKNNTNKGFENNGVVDMEKAEQFLCSMLGDDSDLNLALVRDVICE